VSCGKEKKEKWFWMDRRSGGEGGRGERICGNDGRGRGGIKEHFKGIFLVSDFTITKKTNSSHYPKAKP